MTVEYQYASAHLGVVNGSHDFAVIVAPGVTFYTGGFEDAKTLKGALDRGVIAGTFDPTSQDYFNTHISSYIAVVDLRVTA